MRGDATLLQDSSNALAVAFISKLDGRYIDCHRHRRQPIVCPFSSLGACRLEDKITNRHHQAAIFSNANKHIGRHKAQFRVLPAKKGFQPADPSSRDIHLRLVNEKQLLLVESHAQSILERQSFHGLGVQFRCIQLKVVATAVFGAIHGSIGVLDQGFAILAVFGEHADAEATANIEGITLNNEFGRHGVHEALGGNRHVWDILHIGKNDEEFVAAEAGHSVLLTGKSSQTGGDVLQQNVTDGMPE